MTTRAEAIHLAAQALAEARAERQWQLASEAAAGDQAELPKAA